MIAREQVEAILKINGVTPTAPDEEIRSVLMSARYSKDEVDTAIMVLREDVKTKQTRVDGLHKVFRSQEALNSSEIANLLGIDTDVTNKVDVEVRNRAAVTLQYTLIWFLSLALALGGILGYMYLNSIGVFHPSSNVNFVQR
tara:strand:- start:2057 stop:2482 length:426 start_codon:yes stop_codon:yes gene_type:complete